MLRREHGKGWRLEEQSERIKLVRVLPGQGKQAITTRLPWRSSSQTKLLALVIDLRQRMDDLGLSMAEAYELIVVVPEAAPGQLNWVEISTRYEQFRLNNGCKQTTYDRDERYKITNTLKLLDRPKRAPKDGKALLTAYAVEHLENLAPGGSGRKRHLSDVARLLTFAVKRCGAVHQWLPPDKEEMALLVGQREDPNTDTVPIKPEQLHGLLLSLEKNPELRLAVGLVGLYGLRPSELMALKVEDGELKAGNVKRNKQMAKNPKRPRLLQPLDLQDLPGEGARCLKLYASGLVKLPTAIANAKDFKTCGAAFRQYLDRHPYWQSLQVDTNGMVPYSRRARRGQGHGDESAQRAERRRLRRPHLLERLLAGARVEASARRGTGGGVGQHLVGAHLEGGGRAHPGPAGIRPRRHVGGELRRQHYGLRRQPDHRSVGVCGMRRRLICWHDRVVLVLVMSVRHVPGMGRGDGVHGVC